MILADFNSALESFVLRCKQITGHVPESITLPEEMYNRIETSLIMSSRYIPFNPSISRDISYYFSHGVCTIKRGTPKRKDSWLESRMTCLYTGEICS